MIKIPFNKPCIIGNELTYIQDAVLSGHIAGDGVFTKKCHQFFTEKYGFKKCLLTTSCTHALEMAAILVNIQPGDEVIMPSYTFVSTANAFVLRGAKIVFVDSLPNHPNMNCDSVEALITSKTKCIVCVHYAGTACDMDVLMSLAAKYNLFVVEDAAQAIDGYYKGRPLGSIGHLAAFSFHETKNIISGEGGMLVLNDESFFERAEIIREKGTNRSQFFRGEVDKYGWVDVGSSYLPSEIISAYLYAQLEELDKIQKRRSELWDNYASGLKGLNKYEIKLPSIPSYSSNNAHMFYIVCKSIEQRNLIINHLKSKGILSVFHYISLHSSKYFISQHDGRDLFYSDLYTDCLLRLPLFYTLDNALQTEVINAIENSLK